MNKKKKNIVFVLTDQQRFDTLGCNGSTQCKTPAVDELAKSGINFTHAFTPIALCSPARGSIITGLFPHNHGQLTNTGDNFNGVFDKNILDKNSWIKLIQDAGYNTGYVGKWHLPLEGDRVFWGINDWNLYRDYYSELREQGIGKFYDYHGDSSMKSEWGITNPPSWGRSGLTHEQMQETWTANKTIDQINKFAKENKPFMVFTSFKGPHWDYMVPEPYDTMYDPRSIEKWGNFDDPFIDKPSIQQKEILRWNAGHLTWRDWQEMIAVYWGYCSFIDDELKRIISSLKDNNIYDETIIIFSTDHGDMIGSHRIFNKGFQMYEETHRIPFILRDPDHISQGTPIESFISHVDIFNTILDYCGVEKTENNDGRSLVPLMENNKIDWRDDIFAEFHGYEPCLTSIRMVRTKSWKYVYNPFSIDELYDLESDPHEIHNLAPRIGHKAVLRRMKERMIEWMRKTKDDLGRKSQGRVDSFDLIFSKEDMWDPNMSS
tara:strand:- start:10268 stop:11737 length:1470 start_codon:yes stop_codon:yes gene_type:complete